MTRHTLSLAALIALMTGCSDFGGALDPYADMDAGSDMPKVTTPDMPADLAAAPVDEGMDTPDLTQPVPDMPVIMELPVPKELQAVPESTGVTLTWLPARGAIRYEVRINGGPWKSTGSEMQFIHEDAPGGTVTSATITASDMTERPHVTLNAQDIIGEPGPEQTYEVRAIHEDGASTPSEPTTAQRPFEVDTITWERQDEGSTDWQPLPAATGNATLDATAAPEGDTHTYRALITPIASDTFTSTSDPGARLAAVQVSAGSRHACALLNTGDVKCWGDNAFGQLGSGDLIQLSQDPNNYKIGTVLLPVKATAISAGLASNCALGVDQNIYCWGSFDSYLLPYNDMNGQKFVGQLNPEDINVKSIPDGHSQHICFVTSDDNVRCFWRNDTGQSGAETEDTVSLKNLVSDVNLGGEKVDYVEGSFSHTCAHLQNGLVTCWGSSFWYQNQPSVIGTQVGDMPPPLFDTLNQSTQTDKIFSGGLSNTCSINDSRTLLCWGRGVDNGLLGDGQNANIGPPGTYPVVLDGLGLFFRKVLISSRNICVLTDTYNLYCWGSGENGINGLGNNDTIGDQITDRLTQPIPLGGPVRSAFLSPFKFACAVVMGESRCWGANEQLQLGIPSLPITEIIGDDAGEMPPQPVQLW